MPLLWDINLNLFNLKPNPGANILRSLPKSITYNIGIYLHPFVKIYGQRILFYFPMPSHLPPMFDVLLFYCSGMILEQLL